MKIGTWKDGLRMLAIIAASIFVLCLIGIAMEERKPTREAIESVLPAINAEVRMSSVNLEIRNSGKDRWADLKVTLDGGFEARSWSLRPGEKTQIALNDFIDSERNRFQPFKKKAKYVVLTVPGHKTTAFEF